MLALAYCWVFLADQNQEGVELNVDSSYSSILEVEIWSFLDQNNMIRPQKESTTEPTMVLRKEHS